jgi:hypothetical protein
MAKVKDLSIEDLEFLIEQKVLEIVGDPDSGLELETEFKQELGRRLRASSRRISHEEIVRKFGEGSLD